MHFSMRSSSPVVVTDHPYDDHAYSSTRMLEDDAPSPSSSSSIDEEYDFGDAGMLYSLIYFVYCFVSKNSCL